MISDCTNVKRELKVLHLEDSEFDADLILLELQSEWPACEIIHVDTRASFVEALRQGGIDVVLSDFALRGFDGLAALEIVRTSYPAIPFILISGTIGEEKAVAVLKAGAIDYVLKDRPARLVPAIKRALQDMADEARRRETEERFRQLAETSSDVFWFADLNPLRIRYISPAVEQIWGRKPEEFYADPMVGLADVHPDDRSRVEQNFNAWLAGDRLSFDEEYRVIRRDGSIRWVYDTGTFTTDATGQRKRMNGISRDVTAIKEAAEQSLRAQRLESIGLLAGGVAHDLNNALAPILMGLDLLRPSVTTENKRTFAQMESSATRGAAMVRQLLSFARGAEGRKMVVDPRRALREVEQLATSTFPKAIRTCLNLPAEVGHVEVDPTLLHQVLLNLCVNARDAMPGGGTLFLEVENTHIDESYAGFIRDAKPGPHVVFKVTDSGMGIPAEVLPKIFDPFFTTKPPGVGTGLGLTTVAGIVHNHGGFVRVYSEPGKGTAFKIFLPAVASDSSSPLAHAPKIPEFHFHGESVLVADDEEPVRLLLKGLLERCGFNVVLANDGTEALAAFASHRDTIKVVITDERMPHMDGMALVRTLRHMSPNLKVIAMSGLPNESRLKEFAALGVPCVLHKPFAMAELIEALQAALETQMQP